MADIFHNERDLIKHKSINIISGVNNWATFFYQYPELLNKLYLYQSNWLGSKIKSSFKIKIGGLKTIGEDAKCYKHTGN